MRIVGVGLSSVATNASWAAGLEYEYEVWSDPTGLLIDHYGARSEFEDAPLRHAFILDATGSAILFYEGGVSLGADPELVLSDSERLYGEP